MPITKKNRNSIIVLCAALDASKSFDLGVILLYIVRQGPNSLRCTINYKVVVDGERKLVKIPRKI